MFKGRHHSEETKMKLSEANKGQVPWIKGRHHTAEARMKMSAVRKGKMPWNKGLKGQQVPWMKGKHHTEETKRKMSEALKGRVSPMKGRHHTEEANRKNSEAHKGRVSPTKGRYLTEKHRRKLSEAHKGKHHTEETLRKLSEARKGKHHTDEVKRKISEAHIRAFKKGCYGIRPTVPETKFIKICEKHNLPYRYVGDGKFWVENMNPDFVNVNGGKTAVEILGDYWHNEAKFPKRKFSERVRRFAKYGWLVIGIWGSELNELPEEEIVRRVKPF